MEDVKTANILLIVLLVLGALILALTIFGKETVNGTPVVKSVFGVRLSKKTPKLDAAGLPMKDAAGNTIYA